MASNILEPEAVDPIPRWTASLRAMRLQWEAIGAHMEQEQRERDQEQAEAWVRAHSEMLEQYTKLRDEGHWHRGSADLLTVIGRRHRETVHCAILAWLMTPIRPHGLGVAFCRWVLASTGGVPDADLWSFWAKTEDARRGQRADIVLRGPACTLIIEAKIGASEHEDQCDRLFQTYRNQPGVRFVFLTPDGRLPETASGDAATAFHRMSFRQIRDALRSMLNQGHDHAPGRTTAVSYLQTLEATFP